MGNVSSLGGKIPTQWTAQRVMTTWQVGICLSKSSRARLLDDTWNPNGAQGALSGDDGDADCVDAEV